MSEATPVRERINPRRTGTAGHRPRHAPIHKSPWPWRDRSGRLSGLKAAALVIEIAPAAWIAWQFASHTLGARPITEMIHQTGLWAIRFLILSLLVSPLRALFTVHRLVLVRRQLGVTALLYSLAHLVLYAADENWKLVTVVSEIWLRFYLTIGFVALVGLLVLGVTSFDGMLQRMGHWWKRVHRLVYGIAVLALLHFFMQSKSNVDQALLVAGIFLWLMCWRAMPAGPDRAPLPILLLAAAATLLTAVVEYAWFALATNVPPLRPLGAELNIAYGPHAAGQVLLLGLSMAVATALYWAYQRERLRAGLPFAVALYGGGALIVVAIVYAFQLTDWMPDDWSFWPPATGFVAALGIAGILRWGVPNLRAVLDVACALCLLVTLGVGLFT